MQSRGISHSVLQVLKPLLGIGKALGLAVGNPEKVGSFKILIDSDGSLKIANGRVKISAVEINATEHILRARVTRVSGHHRLRELPGFLDFAGAEPGYGGIDSNVGITGGRLKGLVQFARGFVEARFGDGKVSELTEAKCNGSIVMAFRFDFIASREGGFGGLKIVLE